MARGAHRDEIEIKLRADDLNKVRRQLAFLKARVISPRVYERNTLYDTPAMDLRRRGRLVRIRVEESADRASVHGRTRIPGAMLTYKGPSAPAKGKGRAARATRSRPRFKVKAEIELAIAREPEMAAIFDILGLRPSFQYEKYRTTYVLPGISGLKIELDETPVGNFLELEGSRRGIDRAARLLGYRLSDYITESYGALYLSDCRRRGRKPGHMLFSATKKSR